jgi:hypothetical protein
MSMYIQVFCRVSKILLLYQVTALYSSFLATIKDFHQHGLDASEYLECILTGWNVFFLIHLQLLWMYQNLLHQLRSDPSILDQLICIQYYLQKIYIGINMVSESDYLNYKYHFQEHLHFLKVNKDFCSFFIVVIFHYFNQNYLENIIETYSLLFYKLKKSISPELFLLLLLEKYLYSN